MHRLLSAVIVLIFSAMLPAYGQREKNIVYKIGVGELIYTPANGGNADSPGKVLKSVAETLLTGQTSSQQPQYAEAVRASIVNGLSKVRLFCLTDGNFTEDELSGAVPALYADGTITNISTVSKSESTKDSKGKTTTNTYYRGLVSVTVNLKDACDGTVVDSHTFSISDSGGSWMASGEKAITDALQYLTGRVADHYNRLFPLNASVIEGGKFKKNKQQEVYIDLGFTDGVYKGQQFDVYLVKTIAGKEARTVIGRLKIEEVEGDEISLCKVTKGGDKIKTALDSGQTILVITR